MLFQIPGHPSLDLNLSANKIPLGWAHIYVGMTNQRFRVLILVPQWCDIAILGMALGAFLDVIV